MKSAKLVVLKPTGRALFHLSRVRKIKEVIGTFSFLSFSPSFFLGCLSCCSFEAKYAEQGYHCFTVTCTVGGDIKLSLLDRGLWLIDVIKLFSIILALL